MTRMTSPASIVRYSAGDAATGRCSTEVETIWRLTRKPRMREDAKSRKLKRSGDVRMAYTAFRPNSEGSDSKGNNHDIIRKNVGKQSTFHGIWMF